MPKSTCKQVVYRLKYNENNGKSWHCEKFEKIFEGLQLGKIWRPALGKFLHKDILSDERKQIRKKPEKFKNVVTNTDK